jgi:hypothetical protein
LASSDVDVFVDHFDKLASVESEFYKVSEEGESPPLHVTVYRDTPETDHLTGISYGLSLVRHPKWKTGRPELMISVASTDDSWVLAMAEVAYRLRWKCPFCYGETIRFGTAISKESALDAFLVFAPGALSREDATVRLRDWTVHVAQLYPIYEREIAVIERDGLEAFWKRLPSDLTDVHRQPIT